MFFVKTITYHSVCFDPGRSRLVYGHAIIHTSIQPNPAQWLQTPDCRSTTLSTRTQSYQTSNTRIQMPAKLSSNSMPVSIKLLCVKWFDPFLSVFATGIQTEVEINCLLTDLHLRSSIFRVFQSNACIFYRVKMCHRAKKIVHPSPSYGKGPRFHGWTTSWLSCQQTDSDQWCIIHIFNLNPVHLDLGNELHRQFVAWFSWYQYFWPNSISKDISLIVFEVIYFWM